MKSLLNKLWIGLKIAGLIGILSTVKEDSISKFDILWGKIKEYTEIKRDLYKEKCTENDTNKAWERIVDYSNENFPEILIEENEDIDYWKLKELCRKNRKLFANTQDINNLNQGKITLGDIIVDEKNKNFSYNGKNIKYDTIIFKREKETIDDAVLAWTDKNNTTYINLTKIKEWSRYIYNEGPKFKNPESFEKYMMKELYDTVIKEVENKNNLPFAFLFTYHEFENEFVRAVVESCINHEAMHSIYKYDNYKNEKETYLYEIAKDPKFNSWTFYTTYSYKNLKEFYKTFEKAGYSKEDIRKMKPEKRSEVAKNILDSFN